MAMNTNKLTRLPSFGYFSYVYYILDCQKHLVALISAILLFLDFGMAFKKVDKAVI